MALERVMFEAPLKAKVDMSEKQYYAVMIDSSAEFTCDIADAAGDAIGVTQNNPKLGMAASVALEGITKISVKSGSSVVAGSGVAITNGQASGTGNFGVALESATGPCLVSLLLKNINPT